MNQIFDVLDEGVDRTHVSAAKIRNGLIILLELARTYHFQGFSFDHLAKTHSIPLEELISAAYRLEQIGLIIYDRTIPDGVRLKEEPGNRWIIETIPVLMQSF